MNVTSSEIEIGDVDRVAAITGISVSHLIKLRLYQPEKSPPHFRVGRLVKYPLTGPNSLQTWIAERVQAAGYGVSG